MSIRSKKPIIICAFPGAGKSFAGSVVNNKRVVDLDIHTFPKNQYPNNYVDAVQGLYNSGEFDYILCACHESVRDAFREAGLHFIVVAPACKEKCRSECLTRLLRAGKDIEYLEYVSTHWDEFFDSLSKESAPTIKLENTQYLSDIL